VSAQFIAVCPLSPKDFPNDAQQHSNNRLIYPTAAKVSNIKEFRIVYSRRVRTSIQSAIIVSILIGGRFGKLPSNDTENAHKQHPQQNLQKLTINPNHSSSKSKNLHLLYILHVSRVVPGINIQPKTDQ